MEHAIRSAVPDDRVAVVRLVSEAYGPWVAVMGGRPKPIDADYAVLIAEERVHLAFSATGSLDGLIAVQLARVRHRRPHAGRGTGPRRADA